MHITERGIPKVKPAYFLLSIFSALVLLSQINLAAAADPPLSDATENCLSCHETATPGIVEDWKRSMHARMTPASALAKKKLERKVSAESIPEKISGVAVGCAECHTLAPGDHKDTFDHEGEPVHSVVTPTDCATCHPVEAGQYEKNKMAQANKILVDNPLYQDLAGLINGVHSYENGKISRIQPTDMTNADSCFHCHGTVVEVKGTVTRETDLGDFEFPVMSGWPNQGVGRVNPDGSKGSCAACHTRHQFSIKTAREPYTCSQCHKGPDVPAYKVYSVSKHGNIFFTHKYEWNLNATPWTPGKDFTAPTCASCHVSLLVDPGGDVIVERTHQMNDRLPWRLLGLPYAHPQPKSADTSIIRNSVGLPLPTEFTGEIAKDFLIDAQEMERRKLTMQRTCMACHSQTWINGHWEKLEHSIKTTNEMTMAATRLLMRGWETGAVKGPSAAGSPFDEALERKWIEQWLFFANSTRLASAMSGADYGVFDNGRWNLSKNLQEMSDWLEFRLNTMK